MSSKIWLGPHAVKGTISKIDGTHVEIKWGDKGQFARVPYAECEMVNVGDEVEFVLVPVDIRRVSTS